MSSTCTAGPLIYVVCGVSGCGKSTVGATLAERLNCTFYDADSFHPPCNISKMRSGIPLTDEDRWPWLETLKQLLVKHVAESTPAVLACSALKPAYRQLLRSAADAPCAQGGQPQQQQQSSVPAAAGAHPGSRPEAGRPSSQVEPSSPDAGNKQQHPPTIAFVLLNPPRAVLQARLDARTAAGAHFMPASLLDSQLQQLEVPDPAEFYMCFGCCPVPGLEVLQQAPQGSVRAPIKGAGGAFEDILSEGQIAEAIIQAAGRKNTT